MPTPPFILNPGDPVPKGYIAGPWLTLSPTDEGWIAVGASDKGGPARRNPQWSTKVTAANPSAVLTATASVTQDPSEWGLQEWQYAPDAELITALYAVHQQADPKVDVTPYYGPVYHTSPLPAGVSGFQAESQWIVPIGPARLGVGLTSNTYAAPKSFYTINFYEALWSDGPLWSAGNPALPTGSGSPVTVEDVATASSRAFLGSILGPTPASPTEYINLPDLSSFQPWNDGTTDIGVAVRGIVQAAVEGILPTFAVSIGGTFIKGPTAGCELLMRFPRYRYFYAVNPQRNFPRDDGYEISTERSYPPPVDSIRSFPRIP